MRFENEFEERVRVGWKIGEPISNKVEKVVDETKFTAVMLMSAVLYDKDKVGAPAVILRALEGWLMNQELEPVLVESS